MSSSIPMPPYEYAVLQSSVTDLDQCPSNMWSRMRAITGILVEA